MLKLTQRITAEQRYTLVNSEHLSLDVFCLSMESLIVVFRDILGSKVKSIHCKHCDDLLDSIYKVIEIRRRFLHNTDYSTEKDQMSVMHEIFELSSSFRVNFFRHALERINPNTKEARFWNSHLVSSLHFTSVINEEKIYPES